MRKRHTDCGDREIKGVLRTVVEEIILEVGKNKQRERERGVGLTGVRESGWTASQ